MTEDIIVSRPVAKLRRIYTEKISVPLHAVYQDRQLYHNYPEFQRDYVWTPKLKKELIQSIIQGFYIPSIIMVPVPPDNHGQWFVIDGQQRLTTIMQEMAVLSGDEKRIVNGRNNSFYYPLTEEEAKVFRSYPIEFVIINNYDPELLSSMFRRLQNQLPLTTGEKLYSYLSPVTSIAKIISEFSYFGETYRTSTQETFNTSKRTNKRKQFFQCAMYCVAIEMSQPFADFSSSRMHKFAEVQEVPSILCDNVINKMSMTDITFNGTSVYSMTGVLAQYMTTWILDFIGYDLFESEKGCLKEFFEQMIVYDRESWKSGRASLFAGMINKKYQRDFFRQNLGKLVYSEKYSAGLRHKFSPEHTLNNAASFIGWLRHDGICPGCKEQSVSVNRINDHCFRPGQVSCNITLQR